MKKSAFLIVLLSAFAAPATATYFIAEYVPSSSGSPSSPGPGAPALPPGLHVQVIDGAIALGNAGGTLNFSAGQFGFTSSITTPPVLVPKDPGIKSTPPPVFNRSTGSGAASANGAAANGSGVDCIVR